MLATVLHWLFGKAPTDHLTDQYDKEQSEVFVKKAEEGNNENCVKTKKQRNSSTLQEESAIEMVEPANFFEYEQQDWAAIENIV